MERLRAGSRLPPLTGGPDGIQMWSTRGRRTSAALRGAEGSGGPSNVKVLLRLIPDMLIRDLVLLRYRGKAFAINLTSSMLRVHLFCVKDFGRGADAQSFLTCSKLLNAKGHLVSGTWRSQFHLKSFILGLLVFRHGAR